MSIHQIIRTTLVVVVTLSLFNATSSRAQGGRLLDQTGCACCPVCDHVCKLDAEKVDVEKTCFNVESKAICIPRVVFPWQKAKKNACSSCDSCSGQGCTACVHNGARVRKVCVLTTEKYKCPACEYTWSAEKKEASGCCASGCGASGAYCDSPAAIDPAIPQSDELPSPPAELPTPVDRVSGRVSDHFGQSLHVPLLNRPIASQY